MTFTFCSLLSNQGKAIRWGIVGLNLSVLGGLLAYRLGYQLPLTRCLFQMVFGFPSPSCGMTRSLLALSQGHWPLALSYHVFTPVFALLGGLAGLQAGIELASGRSLGFSTHRPLTLTYRHIINGRSLMLIGGLFLAYYLARLYVRYTIGELPGTHPTSLWDWFVTGAKAL